MTAVLPLPRRGGAPHYGAGATRGNVVRLAGNGELRARLASIAAKVVLLGPTGAGKTCAIRSVADEDPVSTEVPSCAAGGDATTTVGMDFASAMLQGSRLLVFGVPGMPHFAFMWPLLLRGADGVVVMLDARDPDILEHCRAWIATVATTAPQAAVVVGVTHVDVVPEAALDALRRQHPGVPVLGVDARQRGQVLELVGALGIDAR